MKYVEFDFSEMVVIHATIWCELYVDYQHRTCYNRGSRTGPSAPAEGAVPGILTIPIRTPVPIIPHTWD